MKTMLWSILMATFGFIGFIWTTSKVVYLLFYLIDKKIIR